jgi:hypothetical protein
MNCQEGVEKVLRGDEKNGEEMIGEHKSYWDKKVGSDKNKIDNGFKINK